MRSKLVTLEVTPDHWRAARAEAAKRGISIRRLFLEWILPGLCALPPAPFQVDQEDEPQD